MAKQLKLDQREWIEIINSNGEVTGGFYWNPSDIGIVDRCEKVVDYLDHVKIPEGEDVIEIINSLSEQIKEQFDFLLSPGAAKELFKWKEPLSPQPDGTFYVEYVMDQIARFIESELNVRIKKTTAKIEQYIKKYEK